MIGRRVGIALAVAAVVGGRQAGAYIVDDGLRWNNTFLSGPGLSQGDPTTLQWSFVADGTSLPSGQNEPAAGSSLVSQLDSVFGVTGQPNANGANYSSRPWFNLFSSSFNRWSSVSGLSYVYVTDDGAAVAQGVNGSATRGDVRIGGHFIDGGSGTNVLAYNYFPTFGDMVIDTSNFVPGNFSDATNNYRFLRNVVMHEHGHGIGLQHVDPTNGTKLMEAFINLGFDGPQFDDILSAQRLYGDPLEKNGGNDEIETATPLGPLTRGVTVSRGTSASNTSTVVAATDTDFISIDDDSDRDFFSFSVSAAMYVSLTVSPRGPTYLQGTQGGTTTSFNAAALANLRLQLFSKDGASSLALVNATGVGGSETISGLLLPGAGTYFFDVFTLTSNLAQMYRFDLTATAIPGDYNFDGFVDSADYTVWADHFGQTGANLIGDGNGDGVVNSADYTIWADHFGVGTPPGASLAAVPEPSAMAGLGLVAMGLVRRRR